MRDEATYLDELDRKIMHLGSCVASGDDATTWAALVDALSWVFRTEQVVRKRNPDYYQRRTDHPHGAVLAGLIYFRGQVDHAGQDETYKLDWVKHAVWERFDDVPWRPVETAYRVRSAVFPALHSDAEKDAKYKRDDLYREHVEGESVTVALGAAAALLRTLAGK